MFNLSSVFKGDGKSKDDAATSEVPAVAAIAIKKSDSEKMLPVLASKGFTTDDQIERDGILILKQQTEFNESELVAFKMDDDVVAMVTNVKKMFSTFTDSMSFADNIASQGFMPGIFVATDALIETFHNILFGSANSSDVRMKMQAAIAEYSNFVTAMADNLPEIVFKLEGDQTHLEAAVKEDDADANADTSTDDNAAEGDSADADSTTNTDEASNESTQEEETTKSEKEVIGGVSKSEEDKVAATEAEQIKQALKGDIDEDILNPTVTKGDDESSTEASKKEDESTVSKGDTDETVSGLTTILTAIQKQLNDGLAGVNDKLENVEKSTTDLSNRLDTVEEVAKSADTAVKGTVLSGSDSIVPSEGLGNQTRTMKGDIAQADEDLWGDTALDKLVD